MQRNGLSVDYFCAGGRKAEAGWNFFIHWTGKSRRCADGCHLVKNLLTGNFPIYKMIDTCASEFEGYIPYFYSTYEEENDSIIENKKKIIVPGSGPIRIGQGVEFDYSTVHAVKAIKEAGYEAIIINNNPETVSTDYTTSDKLYFESLCVEDVMNVIEMEKPDGVIVSLGGQTAINLARPLEERGVKLFGTDCAAIEKSENRDAFVVTVKYLFITRFYGLAQRYLMRLYALFYLFLMVYGDREGET